MHVRSLRLHLEMFKPGFKARGSDTWVQQESGGTYYFRKHGVVYILFDRDDKFPWLRVRCDGWHGQYLMTGAVTLVASEKYGTNYICEETTKKKGIYITDI